MRCAQEFRTVGGADHMGFDRTRRRRPDSEIAIFEKRSKSANGRRYLGQVWDEMPVLASA